MEELNLLKEIFLESLIISDDVGCILFSKRFLNSIYNFSRFRNLLHSEIKNKEVFTKEEETTFKLNFPLAILQFSHGCEGMISMMRRENIYSAKKYLSAIEFLNCDLKPFYLKLLSDEKATTPENFEENYKSTKKAWNLLQFQIDEWNYPCRRKPNENEKPNLNGVPKSHKWWFPQKKDYWNSSEEEEDDEEKSVSKNEND